MTKRTAIKRGHKRTVIGLTIGLTVGLAIMGQDLNDSQVKKVRQPAKTAAHVIPVKTSLKQPAINKVIREEHNFASDTYNRSQWSRFFPPKNLAFNTAATDTFKIPLNKAPDGKIVVQTMANNRIVNCTLYGVGARVQDGNGFEIRLSEVSNNQAVFRIAHKQAKGNLQHVYFKFSDCTVQDCEHHNVKVERKIVISQ